MDEAIKFTETVDKLTILVAKTQNAEGEHARGFFGWLLLMMTAVFMYILFAQLEHWTIGYIIFAAVLFFLFIIGCRLAEKIFHKEIIEVTPDTLSIIDKYLVTKKIQTLALPHISNILLAEDHRYAPKFNQTYDEYIQGSATNVSDLPVGGTLDIFYGERIVNFAKNVTRWDAEEIIIRINAFTGNNFNESARKWDEDSYLLGDDEVDLEEAQ